MFRQRFWLLVGMWALFFAIQIAGSMVLGIGMVILGLGAATAGAGAGLEDPAAVAGLGIGMTVFLVVFYAIWLVVILAQQAALVTLASPLEEPAFGTALGRGFKSALPFFGIALIGMVGYFLLAIALGALTSGLGEAGRAIGVFVLLLLSLPMLTYLACRFAVIVPVVAVEQVFNPIAAVRRTWSLTRGKVLSILLAVIGFLLLSLAAFGVAGLAFMATFNAENMETADGVLGLVLFAFLVFSPLFIAYSAYAAAFTAAMHSEVSGGGAESFEEVFA
jgi:hypothetical protein